MEEEGACPRIEGKAPANVLFLDPVNEWVKIDTGRRRK
jgi:hypothetical protein